MFKIGDRVRVISLTKFDYESDHWMMIANLHIGQELIIAEISSGPKDTQLNFETNGYWQDSRNFELVAPSQKVDTISAVNMPVMTEKHKCYCNFRDLLMNGCQCGGI